MTITTAWEAIAVPNTLRIKPSVNQIDKTPLRRQRQFPDAEWGLTKI
jgi:hypothetical protein